MRQYADILAFDKNGQLALVVEVKNKRGTSSDWAAEMRRNLFAHGLLPNAPYFLLALPDTFYLWKNTDNSSDPVEPTQKVNPQPFLQPYFGSSDTTSNDLTGRSFDLVVTSWLNQVIRAQNTQELVNENQDWLISSGLYNQLAGGHLALEAVA
jgi:hypothetical protein